MKRKRICVEAPFGIACYEGNVVDGNFKGVHKGIVGTLADARRWLRYKRPLKIIKIWDQAAARKP